jgi:hypothetical protein
MHSVNNNKGIVLNGSTTKGDSGSPTKGYGLGQQQQRDRIEWVNNKGGQWVNNKGADTGINKGGKSWLTQIVHAFPLCC